MPEVVQGGSNPPLVAGLTALLILVIVRVAVFKFEDLRTYNEEVPMSGNQNQNTVIRSVLDTIWAVGVGCLTGVLPT